MTQSQIEELKTAIDNFTSTKIALQRSDIDHAQATSALDNLLASYKQRTVDGFRCSDEFDRFYTSALKHLEHLRTVTSKPEPEHFREWDEK